MVIAIKNIKVTVTSSSDLQSLFLVNANNRDIVCAEIATAIKRSSETNGVMPLSLLDEDHERVLVDVAWQYESAHELVPV